MTWNPDLRVGHIRGGDVITLRRTLLSVGVLLILGSAGCSGSGSSYEGVDGLAAALRLESLGCEELSKAEVGAEGEGIQTSSGSCRVAGEGVQLFVFDTEKDADSWFERGRMETVPTARGDNWVVVTSTQGVADRIADALGASN